ncbi:MAG: dethiobiotin synthase [Humidesulfovibrio sp.]|uniref:dethiobiotin synthase n=1 Tax=Humidesulfovibrio sp. TaxID=2910988 RepID=UPI0027EE27C6|nr:dethiobiotin synthase [Humidesulfovibrio sp.]MDQ7835937.1 dethiobiotin synthase [Humidesulfovibrio sp.]
MRIFVTGTDTGVGKTVASAWLCLHSGADYWKPIQSGHPPDRDAEDVARLSGARIHPERHLLRLARSPFEAATAEGLRIGLDDFALPATERPLVMEGAGGVLVPLNEDQTMLDLMVSLAAPVVVVARTGLGTINHTCLTLQALRARNLFVTGVILCGEADQPNREAIERFGNVRVLAHIPPLAPLTRDALQRVAPSREALDWVRWKP